MTTLARPRCVRPAAAFARTFGSALRGWPIAAVVLLCCIGCGKKGPQKPDYPMWDALQTFQSTEVMMPVDLAYNNGDMPAFKNAISADTFKTALDAFEKSEIPGQFKNEARQQAKQEAVAQFRQSIELAKSAASKEKIAPSYTAAQKALAELRAPKQAK